MSAKTHYYAVAAKRNGHAQMKFFHSFGFPKSEEEALARITRRLAGDPRFRKTWEGWDFLVLIADVVIEVNAEGSVLLHQNDREHLTAKTF